MRLDTAELLKLKEKIRALQARSSSVNEANTKAILVEPLLALLGWDTLSIEEVDREKRPQGLGRKHQPADYTLAAGGRGQLLIEAKKLGDGLAGGGGLDQLALNGWKAGVVWGVLTNGSKYRMVNLRHEVEVPIDRKVFWDVDLATVGEPGGMPVADALRRLGLMSREALEAGKVAEAWEKERRRDGIAKVVQSIVGGQDSDFIDLIRRKVGDQSITEEELRDVLGGARPDATQGHSKRRLTGRGHPRTTTTVSDLIGAGLAKPGDRWRLVRRGAEYSVEVRADGALVGGGRTFKSPSGAGAGLAGLTAVDGWTHWKYQDAERGWRPIDDLRRQLRSSTLEPRAPARAGRPGQPPAPASPEQHLAGKPAARAVYEQLVRVVRSFAPNASVRANSKHITIARPPVFAAIRCQGDGLRIGLRLPQSQVREHPRLIPQPKGIFEGWDALHVSIQVSRPEEVDEEFGSLLQTAYDSAAT